jgi:ubiquinol-cytochrome c reductase cytochrome c1 subunit
MLNKITLFAIILVANLAFAASNSLPPKQSKWKFDGFFGTLDYQSVQRGFQVYKESCSACHGIKRIAYRNLESIGFSPNEVKAIAAEYTIIDGPNDDGEMFERKAIASDYFVPPYKNEKASRAANNGSYPPDLSLIIKARHDGANYVYSLLTGYGEQPPRDLKIMEGQYYNPYMEGGLIAMAPPLSEDLITYQDNTKATVDQMARDVVNFLQWAAEPEMETRKSMGIKVTLYLFALTAFLYVAYKRIWRKVN